MPETTPGRRFIGGNEARYVKKPEQVFGLFCAWRVQTLLTVICSLCDAIGFVRPQVLIWSHQIVLILIRIGQSNSILMYKIGFTLFWSMRILSQQFFLLSLPLYWVKEVKPNGSCAI